MQAIFRMKSSVIFDQICVFKMMNRQQNFINSLLSNWLKHVAGYIDATGPFITQVVRVRAMPRSFRGGRSGSAVLHASQGQGKLVAEHLEQIIAVHGPPLILKRDRSGKPAPRGRPGRVGEAPDHPAGLAAPVSAVQRGDPSMPAGDQGIAEVRYPGAEHAWPAMWPPPLFGRPYPLCRARNRAGSDEAYTRSGERRLSNGLKMKHGL